MKIFTGVLAACLMALPLTVQAQTYTAQSGVSFFVNTSATATATSGAVRLPNFNGAGTLTVIGTGITGSPSGCTIVLKYSSNAGGGVTSAISTTSFTPATSVQQFTIAPSVANGDRYTAVYSCSSTYPTAGNLYASFSPSSSSAGGAVTVVNSGDACANPSVAKSSVAVNISGTAGTTELVAPSGTKAVSACYFVATVVGTAPTILFEYGTSTACTGTTALTGTMAIPTTTILTMHAGGDTVFQTPASQGLCLVAGGTTPSIQGVLTYVQQ